jgi:hypothetical protein
MFAGQAKPQGNSMQTQEYWIAPDDSYPGATRPDWKDQVRATRGVEVAAETASRLRVRAGPMAMLRLRGKLSPRFRITAV